MSHKRKGQLTVSGEWAKHLRPYLKRLFWKSERNAEREVIQNDSLTPESIQAHDGTLETLLGSIQSSPSQSASLDLWVPEHLTYRRQPIAVEVAMSIVVDKLLSYGLFPNGFTPSEGGRMYHYRKE
jgi:hypothetical protein